MNEKQVCYFPMTLADLQIDTLWQWNIADPFQQHLGKISSQKLLF